MTTQTEALNLIHEQLQKLWLLGDKAAELANPALDAIVALADHIPDATKMAAQPEQEPVVIDAKMDDVLRKAIVRSGKVITPPQPKEPEHKPVAWMRKDETCTDCFVWERTDEHTIPLYTTPPQRKPLDMTEIVRLTYDIDEDKPATMAELFRFARAIEDAHGIKEKNT